MATVLRPPLVSQRQQKFQIGAPDAIPNLLATTLKPAAPANPALPMLAVRWDVSAPLWLSHQSGQPLLRPELTLGIAAAVSPPSLDTPAAAGWNNSKSIGWQATVNPYPNLSVTTLLSSPPPSFVLPLSALRLDACAPVGAPLPRFDLTPNPVIVQPVPGFVRLDAPAPPPKYTTQVDLYPNLAVLFSLIPTPNVVGDDQPTAEAAITAASLTVGTETSQFNDTVLTGLVISQNPLAGSLVAASTAVNIVLSLGPQPVTKSRDAGVRKHRRRYYVEIDGHRFDVANVGEAQTLLSRAKELAAQAADRQAQHILRTSRPNSVSAKPNSVSIPPPVVKVSPELEVDTRPLRNQLRKIYRDTSVTVELRLLLELQQRLEDDDAEAILLLN